MENQATEPIIEFLDVKKEYFLYKNEKARFKAIFTKNRGVKKHPALKGVSFKIYPGESVGIIGKNGAGKYYLAVTEGKAKSSEGTLTDYLKKNGKANMSQVVSANTPGAKKAILHYKVLDQQEINGKSRTLLKIRLETGRHHQIRVQLSHEGLPILGDRKYNPSGEKGTSLGLCSSCLEFKHPRTGKMMKFETEPQGSAFLDFVKKV